MIIIKNEHINLHTLSWCLINITSELTGLKAGKKININLNHNLYLTKMYDIALDDFPASFINERKDLVRSCEELFDLGL